MVSTVYLYTLHTLFTLLLSGSLLELSPLFSLKKDLRGL